MSDLHIILRISACVGTFSDVTRSSLEYGQAPSRHRPERREEPLPSGWTCKTRFQSTPSCEVSWHRAISIETARRSCIQAYCRSLPSGSQKSSAEPARQRPLLSSNWCISCGREILHESMFYEHCGAKQPESHQ
jgi:hypothetical protein